MAAYKRHDPGFLTLGKGGQYLMDREAAQPNDGPPELLARRIGDNELLRIGILQQCRGNTGPDNTSTDFRNKSAARDLFSGENSHNHHSIISDSAAFEFLPTASSSIPDTPAAAWDRPEWSRSRSAYPFL